MHGQISFSSSCLVHQVLLGILAGGCVVEIPIPISASYLQCIILPVSVIFISDNMFCCFLLDNPDSSSDAATKSKRKSGTYLQFNINPISGLILSLTNCPVVQIGQIVHVA